MAGTTAHLALPFIMAAQAQKHVTMNEALRLIDGILQLSVISRGLIDPPASPAEGDRYIPAPDATGAWSGWAGSIAYWTDGAWMRLIPAPGWRAWINNEAQLVIWSGTAWQPIVEAMGYVAQSPDVTVACGHHASATGMAVAEELLAGLSGALRTSSVMIPDRAIVLGVSCRTVTQITGAASFDCGIAGEPNKFGGSLGTAAGSLNTGVIGPQAFYADTPVTLTANGGSFTAGAVRIAIHYLTCTPPEE